MLQTIRILPLAPEHLPLINQWRKDPDFGGAFDSFGPKRELTEADLENAFLIEYDGNFVGDLQYHEVRYGPNVESTAANMGITLLQEFRGVGIGSEAQRLFSDLLLEKYVRVEASTDTENIAEQRALEKAGFIREGILRSAQFRAGSHHDLVSYSRVRELQAK